MDKTIRLLRIQPGLPLKGVAGDTFRINVGVLEPLVEGLDFEFHPELDNSTTMDRATPPHLHVLYALRGLTVSPASPSALTGATFGTTGAAMVDPGTAYNATNQRNNTRRLIEKINALQDQVETMRQVLVSRGIFSA